MGAALAVVVLVWVVFLSIDGAQRWPLGPPPPTTTADMPEALPSSEPTHRNRADIAAPAEPLVGGLVVEVLATSTGRALPGRQVLVVRSSEGAVPLLRVTDDAGRVSWSELPPGPYRVHCQGVHGPYELTAGETLTVTLHVAAGVAVEGLVVGPTLEPLPGADVFLSSQLVDRRPVNVATSDASGHFTIAGVDLSRPRWIWARHPDTGPSEAQGIPPVADGRPAQIVLRCVGADQCRDVCGQVLDASLQPVSGALVACGSPRPRIPGDRAAAHERTGALPPGLSTETDEEGRFELKGVPRWDLVEGLWVQSAGGPPVEWRLHPRSLNCAEDVVVVLPELRTVEGTVSDDGGRPVGRARVGLRDERRPGMTHQVSVDREGRFQLSVPLDPVDLVAWDRDLGSAELRLDAGSAAVRWDPVLGGAPCLVGTVAVSSGARVEGYRVLARFRGQSAWSTVADGRFRIRHAGDPPERMDLLLFPPDHGQAFARAWKKEVAVSRGELLLEVEDVEASAVLRGHLRGMGGRGESIPLFVEQVATGLARTVDAVPPDGRFELTGMPSGRYSIRLLREADTRAFGVDGTEVDLEDGQTVEVEL